MSQDDSAGAAAAARYFLASYSYLLASGNTKDWDKITEDGCVFCESARKTAVDLASRNERVVGGVIDVESIRANETVPGYSYLVITKIRQAPLATATHAGKLTSDISAGVETPANLVLHWKEGAWRLRGLDFAASPLG